MLKAAHNLTLEALGGVRRVALTIEVFGVDARNEASVAWNALVAEFVHWPIHPRYASLAHVATHSSTLTLLLLAIDCVGAHRCRNFLMMKDSRVRVDHGWLMDVPKGLACLPIRLASCLAHNVLLEGDEA